jgi:hypothetical protein
MKACFRSRAMARDIAATDDYVAKRWQQKRVEMLFAHLRILNLDRLRLRGRTTSQVCPAQQPTLSTQSPMPAKPVPAFISGRHGCSKERSRSYGAFLQKVMAPFRQGFPQVVQQPRPASPRALIRQ